jgi:hypothetical protein
MFELAPSDSTMNLSVRPESYVHAVILYVQHYGVLTDWSRLRKACVTSL